MPFFPKKGKEFYATRTCKRKVRYSTVLKAFERFIEIGTNPNTEPEYSLEVYLCPVCNGFHLGNKARKSYRQHRSKREYRKSSCAVHKILLHRTALAKPVNKTTTK